MDLDRAFKALTLLDEVSTDAQKHSDEYGATEVALAYMTYASNILLNLAQAKEFGKVDIFLSMLSQILKQEDINLIYSYPR